MEGDHLSRSNEINNTISFSDKCHHTHMKLDKGERVCMGGQRSLGGGNNKSRDENNGEE